MEAPNCQALGSKRGLNGRFGKAATNLRTIQYGYVYLTHIKVIKSFEILILNQIVEIPIQIKKTITFQKSTSPNK